MVLSKDEQEKLVSKWKSIGSPRIPIHPGGAIIDLAIYLASPRCEEANVKIVRAFLGNSGAPDWF